MPRKASSVTTVGYPGECRINATALRSRRAGASVAGSRTHRCAASATWPHRLVDHANRTVMVLDPILKQVEQAGRIPSACGHVLEVQLGPAVTDRAANDVLAGGGQHHQQRLA